MRCVANSPLLTRQQFILQKRMNNALHQKKNQQEAAQNNL